MRYGAKRLMKLLVVKAMQHRVLARRLGLARVHTSTLHVMKLVTLDGSGYTRPARSHLSHTILTQEHGTVLRFTRCSTVPGILTHSTR